MAAFRRWADQFGGSELYIEPEGPSRAMRNGLHDRKNSEPPAPPTNFLDSYYDFGFNRYLYKPNTLRIPEEKIQADMLAVYTQTRGFRILDVIVRILMRTDYEG